VKAVIGFYGVYDMQAQWEHDQMTRPRDQITEKFLGAAPMTSRKLFFEASPLSYVTVDNNSTRFLLIYGREDDIVFPATQSEKFLTALKQAGFYARTIVVPGAGHFWASEPVDEPSSFGPTPRQRSCGSCKRHCRCWPQMMSVSTTCHRRPRQKRVQSLPLA
jgi:acetyl esterase/lipase